jgi:DNA-binding transcriptional regulator LsrR (DeoR family)
MEAHWFDRMLAAGWVGDVQFRPYTAEGPLLDACPVKAVTLFEIADMVRRIERPEKYVVLLAGPCGECGEPKTDALVPLLTRPSLRLWTHLVTDVQTAASLLTPTSPQPEGPSMSE